MPQSASDKTLTERIENDFMFHPAKDDQGARHQRIRSAARDLAIAIATLVPEGREKSLALTKAEEAMFWANAGIARAD